MGAATLLYAFVEWTVHNKMTADHSCDNKLSVQKASYSEVKKLIEDTPSRGHNIRYPKWYISNTVFCFDGVCKKLSFRDYCKISIWIEKNKALVDYQ